MSGFCLEIVDGKSFYYDDTMEYIRYNIWRMKREKKLNEEIYGWFEGDDFKGDVFEVHRQIVFLIKTIK